MHALPASPPPPPATFPPTDWPNRFQALGPGFYTPVPAQELPDPHWVAVSEDCARHLGWPADWWQQAGALAVFSGNRTWPGMTPLAAVYSGHQFGQWAGQLGDGRALWLGEVASPSGPMELQLKGAGRTPYSRMGDGRAVLRSSIREFLGSEAMHHLGVPTTRALCLTGSALPVRRERAETAAVVTRVAPSFIRFGHFEHFCHHGEHDRLRQLLDFVLDHYHPECREHEEPALALLETVSRRTAELLAHWQCLGFCHGVMNTDNMSILGLTLDYGPFGFLDAFDPQHICNHSDDRGRYAYARQPQVAWWNLHALAQALVPLIGGGRGDEPDVERIQAALSVYGPHFSQCMQRRMRQRLGLRSDHPDDPQLADDLLRRLEADRVDHTIAWRRLCSFDSRPGAENTAMRDLFFDREAFDAWGARYGARLRQEQSKDTDRAARMRQVNPKYILRNHLAQTAIDRAEAGDFSEVHRLLRVLQRPYDEQPEHEADAGFPPDWAGQLQISCSS